MTNDEQEHELASVRVSYQGARCRRCRGPVIWLDTASGGKLAVDPEPTLDGRIELIRSVGSLVAITHGDAPPKGQTRYRVHVASCKPHVRGWRGR